MSEINYQEGHEKAGQAKPVAWRYRYVKKGVTDFQGKQWAGDWKYVPTKEDCNDRPNYEIQALFTAPPAPVTSEGLVKAVRFYEQVKRENPPVETGAWKDAVDWVLKEACLVVNTGIKGGWFDRKGDWRMKWATYIPGHPDANDGWVIPGASWIPSHWMPLPEPPQEVNQ
ncbi:DUF551 domain-containing protein [Escherichia coli]